MAMEIPVLNKYFESVSEVRDARFRDQCTMECEFCDCTRSIKLPGKPLMNDQRVLVTAGAAGIGREIARAFAANGAKVFVCNIDSKRLRNSITRKHN